jgi:cyanate permease
MSLFIKVPLNPSEHQGKDVAIAVWKALQIVEEISSSNWTPRKRRFADNAWQIDRANSWQILQRSNCFELFSYYGEESTAVKIVAMLPTMFAENSVTE